MLTAAIASGDPNSSSQLLGEPAADWTGRRRSSNGPFPRTSFPMSAKPFPTLSFWILRRDPEPYFALAAHLRRLRPARASDRLFRHLSAESSALAGRHAQRRSGLHRQARHPRSSRRDLCTRLRPRTSTTERRAAEKTDRGDGLEGRRGHHHCRRQSRRPTGHLRSQEHRAFSISRGRWAMSICFSICIRASACATQSKISIGSTRHFFAGLLTQHKTKARNSWRRAAAGRMAEHPDRSAGARRQRGSDQLRHRPRRYGLAIFFRLERRFSASARMILLVAEANVPSLWTLERRVARFEGIRHRSRAHSRRHQSLAQGRRRSSQEHREEHQASGLRLPSRTISARPTPPSTSARR